MKKFLLTSLIILSAISVHSQTFSFMYDGILRDYRVHLPPDYTADSLYPMVLNLHGLGSNALEQQLYTGFDFVADTAGIIMVYPNGIANAWNIAFTTGVDDVGFISALIDTMAANYNVDLFEVYSTGMSMGGFMSHRLACELSHRITAIASVTGLLAFFPCTPDRPVPILQMHGTADAVVPYAGVPVTIQHWLDYNNCPVIPVITDLPDIDTTDQCTVTTSYYGFCDDSTEVLLYTINGGEHTWPGATVVIGITNYDINGSVEIWNFFRKYSLENYLGTNEVTATAFDIHIYPNPVSDYAVVEWQGRGERVFDLKVYDLTGKLVKNIAGIHEHRVLLSCEGLRPGLYILECTSGSTFSRCKFLVNRNK